MDHEETEDSIEELGFNSKMVFGSKRNPYSVDLLKGIKEERIAAIERMIKANVAKEQIILYGYTEAEYAEAENFIYMNV